MTDLTPRPERNALGIKTGRDCWPHVVQYRDREGNLHDTPPAGPWKLEIHDLEDYEALARSGDLYGPDHCGHRGGVTDNRRTA